MIIANEDEELLPDSLILAKNSDPLLRSNCVHLADNVHVRNVKRKNAVEEGNQFEYFEWDNGRSETITSLADVEREFVDFKKLEKIRVICRFRPSNSRELWEEKQNGLLQVEPEISGQGVTLAGSSRNSKRKTFFLDNILCWKSSQNRCFRVIGWPMVQSVLAGYNATVFAYGQTGSGKTYTMFGPEGNIFIPKHAGITQRAIALLLKNLRQKVKSPRNMEGTLLSFSIKLQFVQIYREKLLDLLNPVSSAPLRIRFDPKSEAPYVQNSTQTTVLSMKEVVKLMKIAISNRVTDKTNMNAVSSRSHLVMAVIVEQLKHNGTKISSKLNFCDLAGSENIRKTGVKVGSKQFSELRSINLSLSQLTTVINDIVSKRRPSFRSSKLTHLLQDSIGGNTKTTFIVCASPHIFNREETLRSLLLAQSAKYIKNKAKINKDYSSKQLTKVVRDLETEIGKLRILLLQKDAENKKIRTELDQLKNGRKLVVDAFQISCEGEFKNLLSEKVVADSLKDRKSAEKNEHQRVKSLEIVNTMSEEIRRMKTLIESLKWQISENEKKINQQTVVLTSKIASNQQLRNQVIHLEKKLSSESLDKINSEVSLQRLRYQMRSMSAMQEKKLNDMNAAFRGKVEELKKQKDALVQSIWRDCNLGLNVVPMQANHNIVPSSGPAEQVLERFSIDEGVLSGIEADLISILQTWKSRKKKTKIRDLPNPKTSIAFQVRSVIGFFNIAMQELKHYEDGENERSVRKACMKKYRKRISNLLKHINTQEETIITARKENDQLKEEVRKFQNIQGAGV